MCQSQSRGEQDHRLLLALLRRLLLALLRFFFCLLPQLCLLPLPLLSALKPEGLEEGLLPRLLPSLVAP